MRWVIVWPCVPGPRAPRDKQRPLSPFAPWRPGMPEWRYAASRKPNASPYGSKKGPLCRQKPFSGCSQVAIVALRKAAGFPSPSGKTWMWWGQLLLWLMLDMLSLYQDLHWVALDTQANLLGTILDHWIDQGMESLSFQVILDDVFWSGVFRVNGFIRWKDLKARGRQRNHSV